MIIAVTGASGFLGSKLVAKLGESKENRIVVFDPQKHSLLDVDSLISLVKDTDVVYHLAGIKDSNDKEIFPINIIGMANILQAVNISAPNAHFIFPSSFAVYETSSKERIIKEDSILNPRNRYGFTKLLGEELVNFYCRAYNLKITILRIANVYGLSSKANNLVISRFINNVKDGRTIEVVGDGKQTRDFVYISDVVNALILTRSIKDKFNILNICSGEEISINNLAELIAKKMHKKCSLSYRALQEPDGRWKGSYLKAKDAIGWIPKVSLEKGLEKIL